MKKQILALSLGLISVVAFSQKKELRAAEKAIKKNEFTEALSNVKSVDGMLETMDSKYKAQYYFLKAQALAGKNNYEEAAESFNKLFAYEKEIGKQKYSKDAEPMLNALIQKVSNLGADLYNKDKNYKEAAKNFYLTFKLSPKDTSFLYNAAVSASLDKDYDLALEYYKELKDIGYTGITTEYLATDKTSGEVVNLGSKQQRDLMVKTGNYIKPENKLTESKKADIVKNIAYTYVNLGKTKEAIAALQEARKANPKDINLLLNEAQMYIKLEKMDTYKDLMVEAAALQPDNPDLFFNIGVVSYNSKLVDDSVKNFKKVLELKPDYPEGNWMLANALLLKDEPILKKMNELPMSDVKNYNKYSEERKKLFKEVMPIVLKADQQKRTEATVKLLMNLSDLLENEADGDKYRAILKEMN